MDKGIGISQKDLSKIFTSFNRGGNVGSIPGTGMGLTTVNSYLKNMNGYIKIKSKIRKGTIVYVSIPMLL